MIIIIDPNGNCSCGETLRAAVIDYENAHDNYGIKDSTFFQGTEVGVDIVITPKIQSDNE